MKKIAITINVLRNLEGKLKDTLEKNEKPVPEIINIYDMKSVLGFETDEEFIEFMTENFLSIYGFVRLNEQNLTLILNSLTETNKVIILAEDGRKIRPATLYFLSKGAFEVDSVVFSNYDNIQDGEYDAIITEDPTLLAKEFKQTKLIKYDRQYNSHIKNENTITSLNEIK